MFRYIPLCFPGTTCSNPPRYTYYSMSFSVSPKAQKENFGLDRKSDYHLSYRIYTYQLLMFAPLHFDPPLFAVSLSDTCYICLFFGI
jgi:hypothetical protein